MLLIVIVILDYCYDLVLGNHQRYPDIFGNQNGRRHALFQNVPLAATPRIASDLESSARPPLERQISAKVAHVPPAKAQAHPKSSQGASYLCANNEK